MLPGSSPLARGLRGMTALGGIVGRIIPARARFTDKIDDLLTKGKDHPRSRGVYTRQFGCAAHPIGSSPLARGLHAGRPCVAGPPRIIPARAGFTTRSDEAKHDSTDHPRSRGVYRRRPAAAQLLQGSSPLARGLLCAVARGWRWSGIIPARAGFTLVDATLTYCCRDHPRSRGVYLTTSERSSPGVGSSPLARGLHMETTQQGDAGGIIPARAGFAPAAALKRLQQTGSSPLARGLHQSATVWTAAWRIIPARAGFTWT